MKTVKLILKEAGFEGLNIKQIFLVLWFALSLTGLTMNDDAPLWALAIVIASVILSGLLCKKHIKITPHEE